MGLGDKLLDEQYTPDSNYRQNEKIEMPALRSQVPRCPVRFTNDILEYAESPEFLGWKLRKIQRDFLTDLYSVNKKGKPYFKEGVLIAGMRSGKTAIAAVAGTFQTHTLLALDDPAAALHQIPGYRLTVQCIASSQEQSGETIYAAIETIIDNNPWWQQYIAWLEEREQDPRGKGKFSLYKKFTTKYEFIEKNVAILSLHSNSGALAGKTSVCCIFDELSRFDVAEGNIQQKTQKRTAQAVYNTVSRAAKSLGDAAKVITITSPMYEDDYGMQLLLMSGTFKGGSQSNIVETLRAKNKDKVSSLIGYHYTTFEMNPKYDDNGDEIPGGFEEDDFAAERIANPEAYRRDYLAIPPSAVSPFIEYPERIEDCIVNDKAPVLFADKLVEESVETEEGLIVRHYIAKDVIPVKQDLMTKYFVCCDQGEKRDHFVVAMGHGEPAMYLSKDKDGKSIDVQRYKIVIDFVEGWVPDKQNRITVSFQNVEETITYLNELFNIKVVTFDTWNAVDSIQRLFSSGIYTEQLGATLEMYEVFKQLIYHRQIDLPKSEILHKELRQLNVIRSNKIDHPPSGCFTGDTKIKLLNGTTPTIKELANKGKENTFWVYASLADGSVIPAIATNAHKTKRVNKLLEIRLDNNSIIHCTPDHLFMLKDGSYKQAIDLSINDSLMPLYTREVRKHYKKGGCGDYEQIYTNKKWIYTHKIVSSFLEFPARKDEVIHHIDLNQRNNSPENLERLGRAEHSHRHMLINKKAFTKEAIKKRIKSFKKTYASSKELQKKFHENGNKIFNDPIIRQKAIEASRKYHKEHGMSQQLLEYVKSDKGIKQSIKNLKSISKEVLHNNANKVNNGYWKTKEGIKRRKDLAKTQLVDARNIKINREDLYYIDKIKPYMNIVLSYRHITKLVGGSITAWKRRLPNIKFVNNALTFRGYSLKKISYITGLTVTALSKYLKKLGVYDEIINHNHKIISINEINHTEDVYDITIPIYDNFALASGVFVHNSKDYSDAVCRVVWKIYTEFIRDTIHGQFMLPETHRFPTLRSVASAYDMVRANEGNGLGSPIWGNSSQGPYNSVFGKEMIVQSNVIPNLPNTKKGR